MPPLLTLSQAAAALQVSTRSLRRLLNTGALPAVLRGGIEETQMNTTALCPPRAKVAAMAATRRRVTTEWKPTASGAMRADLVPYGQGTKITWSIAVALTRPDGRPATGRDAAATLLIAVAWDAAGRWEARLTPGQDEGERPLTLAGAEGGYPAAQAAVAAALADYAAQTVGLRRGYVPVALRSPLGGGDVVSLI